MNFLKGMIKEALIKKQHKRYENELFSKKMTYDKWITDQEKQLDIVRRVKVIEENKLTIDLITEDFGIEKNRNEGYTSKSAKICQIFSANDWNGRLNEKKYFLQISINMFTENPEFVLHTCQADVIIFTLYEGLLNKITIPLLWEKFQKANTILVYGDEDVKKSRDSERENPWFKPDWSPDRFLSGLYFGGLIAVRRSALKKVYERHKADSRTKFSAGQQEKQKILPEKTAGEELYLLLRELLQEQNCFAKREETGVELPICHIRQVLYHSRESGYEQIRELCLPEEEAVEGTGETVTEYAAEKIEKNHMLSIIIPSRDHPDVLFRCLDSLFEKTRSSLPFEILLVDNGSTEENREIISRKVQELNAGGTCKGNDFRGCRYLYEPMPFNFSRMCNLGAESAEGTLFLFLNDDIEILQPDWMDLLAQKAVLPYAGAVGAKLLYPDSDIIQHAGITNLRVGPAHKLQFLSDSKLQYFGMNRGVHNMLAVTGACLMLRREVFFQAGGFCEELAVAFNDVDLCYKIYENGCYNIVRNDVVFYHHESLSRGKDGESEEKQLRLLREKDRLYERHQEIYGKDPFYHPFLTTDMLESEYSPACRYQVTLDMPWSGAFPCRKKVRSAREDRCLVVGMESAMDLYKWKYGVSPEKGKVKADPKEMGYYFQGYCFVIGGDNACYKKHLLLKNKNSGDIWKVPVDSRYRPDIRDNLADQRNVEMTGFAAKMRKEEIPGGVYQFGMLAEDLCSRQKLVNWSNWVLEIA